MLWVWLSRALGAIGRFLIPPPPRSMDVLDVNARCPSCGNKEGMLEFTRGLDKVQGFNGRPLVKHTCKVCKFAWGEDTVSIAKYPLA